MDALVRMISPVLAIVAVLGCDRQPPPVEAAGGAAQASAALEPTKGNEASGTITFKREGNVVHVQGPLAGMKPGEHGFHIHEKGDCSCPDAECAGPHFSPEKMPHGAPSVAQRHAGDLGNVTADGEGAATVDVKDSVLKLEGDDSIIGRAVVLHANPDDLKSQPSGNAGPRIACGVIKASSTPPTKG